MKPYRKPLLLTIGLLALAYLAVANAVFHYRHPWATDAEQAVWAGSALRFEKVPYEVMRPREGKP